MKESRKPEGAELENRWCKKCFSKTQQELLDSDLQMTGKKTKFLYRCTVCGMTTRMPKYRGMAESTY
tara:strand:+ start:110 stop:310 length:201 start_codon:yes stop_codon:yes gene_type:complete